MPKLFFRVQAMDLPRSTGRRAGRFLGLLLVGVLVASHMLSVSASAQPVTPAPKSNPSPQEQKIRPTAQTQEEWRKAMSRIPPPKKGCFTAAYPKMEWLEVQCAVVVGRPHYPTQGNAPGNLNSAVAISTGSISAAIGSFDTVSGVTTETDSASGQSDTFSLQLNTNYFDVSFCAVGSYCGWQQFVFASRGCLDTTTGNLQDCVYIEYWLRDQSSCPNGWTQISDGNRTHCIVLSPGTLVTPHQSITSLRNLSLSGTLQMNSVTATFGTNGVMFAASDNDLLDLFGNYVWEEAEFNVFGQDDGSQAVFNSGTTLVVRTQIWDRQFGNILPTCLNWGFTRETNNLNVIQRPTIFQSPLPAIVFQESNITSTTPPGCASSMGETHLTTFDGLSYDFQAAGEFLLMQADPDFIVQTRQVSWPSTPNTSINKAVAIKMGKTRVAICLAPTRLEIDGKPDHLDDGKSLSLPGSVSVLRRGNVYFIGRAGGDVVRAEIKSTENMDWMNVYVGHTPGTKVRGLLGNANGTTSDDIAIQAGRVLKQPVSFTDLYGRYTDSWRVPPKESLLCKEERIERDKPVESIYANDLQKNQYEHARDVCIAAGVKDASHLDACILDVTVMNSDNAANAFVGLPPPVGVMRPEWHRR